ncbi:MAG: hypothetical protein RSC76_06720 [Oscillospiraceae bacterium]
MAKMKPLPSASEPTPPDPYDYGDDYRYTEEKSRVGCLGKILIFLVFIVLVYLGYCFIKTEILKS